MGLRPGSTSTAVIMKSRVRNQLTGTAADSQASLYARVIGLTYWPYLLAEVYPACDLPATATKDAHHHDGSCGNLRARDSNMDRLLRRPARGPDAVNLEEANESDGAGQACDQPARVDDRTPHRQSFQAERAPPRSRHLVAENYCAT
jgi:hypothetical protein